MATHVRSRGVQTQPSAAFRLKCSREQQKLCAKLEIQLKNDLNRCFQSAVHSDLVLLADGEEIYAHSAIISSRTPFLYQELCKGTDSVPKRIEIPDITGKKLRTFISKLYTQNNTEEEEAILVSLLRQKFLKQCKFLQNQNFANENNLSQIISPYSIQISSEDKKMENRIVNEETTRDLNILRSKVNAAENREQFENSIKLHSSEPNGDASPAISSEVDGPSDSGFANNTEASGTLHNTNGSSGSDSVFASDKPSAGSKDQDNITVSENEILQELDEAELLQDGEGSVGDSSEKRGLIRRDTFDLIDPALAQDEDEIYNEEDEDYLNDDDDDDVPSKVSWEIGGQPLPSKTPDEPIATSILSISSGSDRHTSTSEAFSKGEVSALVSMSSSTEGAMSLSNSFTAGAFRIVKDASLEEEERSQKLTEMQFGENNVIVTSSENDKAEIQEENTEKILNSEKGVRPKEITVNSGNSWRSSPSPCPEPEEIIYLDKLPPKCESQSVVDDELLQEDEIIVLKLPSQTAAESKDFPTICHSNSKLFSPDSIISDRSPLVDRTIGIPQGTVEIVPILNDFETISINTGKSVFENKTSASRRSSDSLSPDADSLNVDVLFPNHKGSRRETKSKFEANVMPIVSGFSCTFPEDSSSAKPPIGKPKNIECLPIVSGFAVNSITEENSPDIKKDGSTAEDEDRDSTPQPKAGSFFVYIDVGDPVGKSEVPPSIGSRNRNISATSEDDSQATNRTLSIDTSRKDSLSEDDIHISPKIIEASPKTPTSIYMYIEAGSSPKDIPRKPHMRKASHDYSSSPSLKGHFRRLSQGHDTTFDSNDSSIQTVRSKKVQDQQKNTQGTSLVTDQEDDGETICSEFSECIGQERSSSVTSPDDDDGNPQNHGPCSKLGEDLLRMFLEEINTDVIVRVNGEDIKAHKCILSSRCSYFAAMLSGGWLESSGNIINLQGFNYTTVHFALCHIYSGAINIPKDVDITELASIADMLGLEGLRDVVALTLKAKYCHFFHKPCSTCISGVVECLPISANYGLDELYDKSIHWLTRHMGRTWPTKAFASLPEDLLNKCYYTAKAEINVDDVLDMIMTCDKLMATLPQVRWAEPVFSLTSKLLESCTLFLAKNLSDILTTSNFLALGKGQSWNVNALEDTIMVALENLTPDSACSSYVTLARLLGAGEQSLSNEEPELIENFVELLHKIQRQVERYLIHNANRVVHCPSWAQLTPAMQKRIKDAAVIVFEFGKPTAPPPRLTSLNRRFNRAKIHSPAEHSESSTTSSSSGKTAGSRRPTRSAAVPIPKANRPPTAPVTVTPPLRSKQMQSKKSPGDSYRSLTSSLEVKRSPGSLKDSGHSSSPSSRTNRFSDLPSATLRKSTSKEKVTNCRPKSWPTKDKMPHSTKTKESSKDSKPAINTVSLRNTCTRSIAKGSNSPRPKSAVFSTDSTIEVSSTKPVRSLTSTSLREGKVISGRKSASSDTQESPSRLRSSEKSARIQVVRAAREDNKLHSNLRRNMERSGIKAASGSKA